MTIKASKSNDKMNFVKKFYSIVYRTLSQRALWDLSEASGQALKEGLRQKKIPCGSNLNYDYRKAALWAKNCPNFFFFFVWAGTSPKGAGKTEVFSGKLKSRRQAPHGLRGTTALCAKGQGKFTRLWVILIMGLPLLKFSLPPVGNFPCGKSLAILKRLFWDNKSNPYPTVGPIKY
jgi:hypothetical protein